MLSEAPIPLSQIIERDFRGKCDMCGVCCTHISISSKLPDGAQFEKPAGIKCKYLTDNNLCGVWGDKQKQPNVCRNIQPMNSLCRFDLRGVEDGKKQHIEYLQQLEKLTSP